MSTARYVVVTPARNERENIVHTIRSMAAQTRRPELWVIVDDGSSDGTGGIIDAAALEHRWIVALHRKDRGFRKQGGGVVDTFCDGYAKVGDVPWDYLVKFDADLSFEPDFFERCIGRFEANPKLGIGGGMICNDLNGALVCESPSDPAFHVRGATKIYRRPCWEAIGGLIAAPGWDTMDEVKANMLGWTTYTFPEIKLTHHRIAGGADGNWRNYFKNGRANFVVGYHPVFMLAKCAKRIFKRPYLVASLALMCGFADGYLSLKKTRIRDKDVIRYLRSQQLLALLGRKCLWRSYEP